jgi:hypothetical protein
MKRPLLRASLIALLAVAVSYSQPSPIRAVIPFHRYGSTFVLSRIWAQGGYSGRALTVTAREQ